MVLRNQTRVVTSLITLDTNAVVSDLDIKTWGFLIYTEHNKEQENSFDDLMNHILRNGIMPLAQHFFQAHLTHRGTLPKVYC